MSTSRGKLLQNGSRNGSTARTVQVRRASASVKPRQASPAKDFPPLVAIARRLGKALARLSFSGSVACVYNPLDYAIATHAEYLRKYACGPKDYVLLGMNPGPWGMAQTGVPFGEVSVVRDWLRIDGPIGRPTYEHPRRPVLGLDCPRSEVSGARLWGWVRDRFGTPDAFFRRWIVLNYCPLMFLDSDGRNITPDHLRPGEREPLESLCDAALRDALECLGAKWVIGVGKYAERRARAALERADTTVCAAPHPSPANPAANRGWTASMEKALVSAGLTGAIG